MPRSSESVSAGGNSQRVMASSACSQNSRAEIVTVESASVSPAMAAAVAAAVASGVAAEVNVAVGAALVLLAHVCAACREEQGSHEDEKRHGRWMTRAVEPTSGRRKEHGRSEPTERSPL